VAICVEINSVEHNKTWELVNLQAGHQAIRLKWVFKLKRDEVGEVIKHKAQLVPRGFVQQAGVDFDEVYVPVALMESVRVLLALAAQEGWTIHHMDIKSTFLNGDLKEEVYVKQTPRPRNVLWLHKALYGLRQAPQAWNAKLNSTLKALELVASMGSHCWSVSTSTFW
jgi:hypothetical protein